MTRIVKKPDERRRELIDTALELFQTQGYSATTVEAIIRKIGIAKGTFYHYFQSKEDIMAAVVQSLLDRIVEEARAVAADPSLNAIEKIKLMFGGQGSGYSEAHDVTESLHSPENRELHEKTNVETILQLSPILSEVIEQGIREGIFQVDNVLETVQFLLVGSQFLFEHVLFNWSAEEIQNRAKAMATIIERSLGAEKGTFSFLAEMYQKEAQK
ncbi:MAG: TetR/AcrR family transcriptional regulator [Clostridia bacterium]|nr:TetR/AcrR family transcriptional regulator [Clostridia bacterium]